MITAVAVVLAAGGGAGIAVLLSGHRPPQKEAARNAGESTPVTVAPGQDGSPSQDGSAAVQSPSDPSPGPSSAGQVTITPDASQNPDAPSVAAFLGQYFTAINAHSYQSYVSLLSPQEQQGQTQEQFDHGYGSTADSAETLVSISTASDGDLDVAVTFTSHQNPADSPDHEQSCTDWKISLFLEQGDGGYLIDAPPHGYHASYAVCP